MRKKAWFLLIWGGQAFSLLGSEMTGFALGVWLFQRTGLASNFAFVALCTVLPQMLLSPWVGLLVDRYNRRRLMALADSGSALCTLAAALLFFSGRIEVWQVYVLTALSASCGALQGPAYAALVAGSVERRSLGRANGLLQFGQALGQIIAPGLASVLVVSIGVAGVLFIDLATFAAAVSTLLISRLPADPPASEPGDGDAPGLVARWLEGWQALRSTPGLTGLLRFQALFTFLWSMFAVRVSPMLLGFTDVGGLGLALTLAGFGLLAGSLAMTAWGGPRHRLVGLLVFELLSAVAFVVMGLRPSLVLVSAGAFCAHFTLAFVNSLNDTLWQGNTPQAVLGRVLALRQTVMRAATLAAYLLAGGMVDRWIDPLLLPGSPLAGSAGLLFGVGPGRGIALVCSLIGLVKIAAALILAAPVRSRQVLAE